MTSIRRLSFVAVLLAAGVAGPWGANAQEQAADAHAPDQLDFSMFFLADVRDSPECDVRVENGRVVFGDTVTNPAMGCPDAFGWKLMVELRPRWLLGELVDQPPDLAQRPLAALRARGDQRRLLPQRGNLQQRVAGTLPGVSRPDGGCAGERATEPAIAEQMTLAEAAPVDANGDGAVNWDDVPAALKNAVIGGASWGTDLPQPGDGRLHLRPRASIRPTGSRAFSASSRARRGSLRRIGRSRTIRLRATTRRRRPQRSSFRPRGDDQGQLARGRGRSEGGHRSL